MPSHSVVYLNVFPVGFDCLYLYVYLPSIFRYRALGLLSDGKDVITVDNPNDWPEYTNHIHTYYEPMVKGTVIVPQDYLTSVVSLCTSCRGIQTGIEYIDQHRIRLEFNFPLAEILTTFFDSLKRVTSGM